MRRLVLMSAGALVVGAFALGYGLSRGDRASAPVAMPTVVDQVREALAGAYYRPIPPRVLGLGSVDAILSALGDPYTAYLPRSDYARLREETAGSYSGIGVDVVPGQRGLVVVATHPGPARRAGIGVGDVIVRIDGAPTAQLDVAQTLTRIAGLRGTRVELAFLHGGKLQRVSVPRAQVRATVVAGGLLSFAGRRWGDVQVAAFSAGVADSLHRELDRLIRRGAEGFVLDLRGDPGGLLAEGIRTAALFLRRGVVVASLRGVHTPERIYRARSGAVTGLPLVVLVDRGTASSAEVVAAALRDHHRAEIVGERTYGKALVQSVDPLRDGGALELSVAHYYTASGKDISGVGVVPDVHAVDLPDTPTDEALATALLALARPTS